MIDKIMEQIQAIREKHWDRNGYCNNCGGTLPCDAIQLAQKLELAVKALAEVGHSIRTEVNLRYAEPIVGTNASRFIEERLAAIAEVK